MYDASSPKLTRAYNMGTRQVILKILFSRHNIMQALRIIGKAK